MRLARKKPTYIIVFPDGSAPYHTCQRRLVFLGHRIIRKRGPKGTMRVVSCIPQDKAKAFAHSLSKMLSGDYSTSKIDQVEQLAGEIIKFI